jgi:hypothetical protein
MSFRKKREEKNRHLAREKLYNVCSKRINTTMIGAIATIEKYVDGEQFEKIRSEILDKGNNQIRGLHQDFDNYKVDFYTNIVLPIEE